MNTTTASTAQPVTNEKRVDLHHETTHVLKTPIWMLVIRVFQILTSLVIVGLAARLMHDAYLDEEGLALAIGIITWIVLAYILVTELVRSCHSAYHIVAVLCLEGLMLVLWLATFAAVAAERARYKYPTTVSNCFDDGSIFDSKFCIRKRQLEKRDDYVLLFKTGQDMLSAIAGLGALVWILFIVTFVWTLVMFVRGRKQGHFPMTVGGTTVTTENHQMESKPADPNQLNVAQPTPQGYQNQQPTMQQPQPMYAPNQPPYAQTVSPQPSAGPYSPPVGAYSPEGQPQQQPIYAQQPNQQQTPAYPQQGYPPSSPSPVDQAQQHHQSYVSHGSASPPPQELHQNPYQPNQPQEMPHTHYPQQPQQG